VSLIAYDALEPKTFAMKLLRPLLAFSSLWVLSIPNALSQTSVPAAVPPAPPVVQPDPGKQPVRERERTIYVPYDQLEKVFQDGGKGVFLPYREFLDLWNELTLKREEDKDKEPPSDGVISKADYVGHVEGQTLVLDAKLSVESFKKGWVALPITNSPLGGIAEANAGKAVLRSTDKSTDLLLPDKGVYEITLKLMIPIQQVAGKSSTTLALPAAAVSKLIINVPGGGLEFEVAPSAAFTSRPLGGQTELSFFFGSASQTPRLSWGAPQGVTQMTPLLLADTKLESVLGAGSIATTANFDFRILRAPMDKFEISIPAGQEVLGVTGNNIKTWNVTITGDRQQLVVTPDKPVKDSYSFKLQLEGPIAALPADINVPELNIEGASYARGTAAIYSEPQFDVTPLKLDAVVRASTNSEARDKLIAVGSFRVLKQPYQFGLHVEEAKPQIEVNSLTRLDIQRDAINVEAQFNYSVRRVGVFETRITLPAGLNINAVKGDQVAEWKVESGNTLLVKLPEQRTGSVTITVTGRQLRTQPTEEVIVPIFAPLLATRHEAKVAIALHSSLEATTKTPGDFQQEDVSSVTPMLSIFPSLPVEATLAFRYRDAAKPATLGFKSRDAQVSVEVLTLVEAKEQSTRHEWTLAVDVSYAAIDKLILAVPKAVANDIRLVDPAVKETHKDYKPTEAEQKLPDATSYTFWEVILRSEKLGAFQLTLSHEKQGALEAGKTGKVELLQVHVPGAFSETGQIAVLKDNSLELRNAVPEGLEEIDARELHGPLQKAGVFQAYKYRALPFKLAVETAKNAWFAVPQAVITHADLTTAVATDEAQSTEVIYWVKNIDLQFLVVKLPKGARLVSDIFVGKEAQQPMKREGSNDLMVRLPSGAASTRDAFPVRFVFELPSFHPGEKLGMMGSIVLPSANVPEVKIFETRHRPFLPESSHYTSFEGPLTQAVSERGWGRLQRTLRYVLPLGGGLSDAMIATLSNVQAERNGSDNWSVPPQVAPDVRSLYDFQVPQQGHAETLRRLGPPADVTAHFRSKGVTFTLEAIAFLLVIGAGVVGLRWPLSRKVAFTVLTGVTATMALGIFSPANSLVAIAIIRAVFCVALLWLVLGVLPVLGFISSRLEGRPRPPKSPPPPSSPGPVAPRSPVLPNLVPPPSAPEMPGGTTTGSSSPVQVIQVPEMKEDPKPKE
jgi:hypothetical protein